jgi:O-acetylserine/cysteine efflux transporter
MVFLVPRPRIPPGYLVSYGLAIGAGQFGLLFLALHLGFPAGISSLLIQVQVFFTIGLAVLFAGDRVRLHQLGGACLAAIGIVALLAERSRGASADALGLFLVIAAAACWASGNVIAKRAGQRHPLDMFHLVVWSSLVAPLPLFALSFATEGGLAPWRGMADASLLAWASLVFMAYAATVLAFGLWNRLLHRHPAAAVTPFALLIPISGIVSAWFFLDEPLSFVEALAALVVLLGLCVTVFGARTSVPKAAVAAPVK